ncbi:Conserved_hypothetical protein [Hexamita inflata]|uniref:Uncharacterized protein n=1 Tax=Hexamita inflata TaxID=28002 RepID=A0AA86R655_9EUKA|nr:Conserved hypothetical protein [Hexamita inflata]
MLQIVEQNQAASISIKQQLQRILLDKNDKLEKSINEQLQKAFISVEFAIRQNPLYVMFEEKLNCNPLTDHQSPKDVYPLFEQQISNIKQVIFTSLTGTIMLSNQQAYQNITQAYEEQDLLIYNLITMVSKHDNLLNKLELVKNEQNEQIINQLTKMKWELFKAHQQIKEKKTIGMTYLGDNMEIPTDKLSEDPAELIRKYQLINKLYMDLQAVLQKQTDDNKDLQQIIMNLKLELHENQQKTKLNEDHNNLLSQRLKSKQTTEIKTDNQDNETQTENKTQNYNVLEDKGIQVIQSYAAQKQQLIEAKKKMNEYVYVGNMKRNSSSLNKIITQQQLQINVEKVEIEPSHSFDEETEKDYIFTGVQVYSYGNDNDVHLIQGLQSNTKKKTKDLNKYIPSKLEFQEITEDVQVEDKKNKTTDKTIKQRYKDMVKRDASIEVEVENMIKKRKQEQILASESLKMLENNNSQPNNTKTKITKPAKGDKFDTKQIKALVPKGKKILQNEYSKSVDFGDSTDQQYNLNLIKKLQMQLQALEQQDPKKIIQPDLQAEQIQHNSSQNHIQEPRVIFTEPKKFTFTVENSTQTFDQSSWGFKKTRSEQLKSVFRPTLVESEFQTLEEQKVPIETKGIQTDENNVQLISQVQLEKIYIQVQDEIKSKTETLIQQVEAKSELSEKQELRETPTDLKKYNESQTLVPHNSYLVDNKNEIGKNINQIQNTKPKLNMTDIKYQTLIILQQKAVSSQGTRELQSKESSRIQSQILTNSNQDYQDKQQNKFNNPDKQEVEQINKFELIKESEVVKINEPIKQDEVQQQTNESQITSNKQEQDQTNQKEFQFDTEIKDEIQILQEQLNMMQNGNNNVLDELNKQLDDKQQDNNENTHIQNNEVDKNQQQNNDNKNKTNTEIFMINMSTQTVEIHTKPALNTQILDQSKLIENPLINLQQFQICSQYLIDNGQKIVLKQHFNNISSEAQEMIVKQQNESQIKNIPNQQQEIQQTNSQNSQLTFIQVFSQQYYANQLYFESQQLLTNKNIDQNKSTNLQQTKMTHVIQSTDQQQGEENIKLKENINNNTQVVHNYDNNIKYYEQANNQSTPKQNTIQSIQINQISQGTKNILLNSIPIVYSSYLPQSDSYSLQTDSNKVQLLVDKEMMTDMGISILQQSNKDVVVNQLIQNVADKKLEIAMQEIGIQLEIQDTQHQFHEQLQKLDIREVGIQVDGKDHETDITDFSLVKQFIELQEKQIKEEIQDQYQNIRKFQQNIDQDNQKQAAQPQKVEQPKMLLKPIKSILKSDKTIQEQTNKPEINNRSNKFDNTFKNSIISDKSRKSKDESDFTDNQQLLGFRREQKLNNQSQIIQNIKNHGKNQNTPNIQPKLQAIDNIIQSPIQNNLLPLAQSTPVIKLGESSKLLSFVQQPLDSVNKSILEAVFQQFRPTLPNPKVQIDQTHKTYINNQQFEMKLEGNHIFTKNNTQFKPQNWFVKENNIIDPYGAILNSRGEILDENQKPIVNYINYIEKKQWQILQKLDEHPTVKNILNSSASIFSQRMFEKIIWQDYKKQQLQEFWRGVDFIEFMKKEHARLDKSTGIEYFERSPSPSLAEQRKLPKLYQSVTQSILRSPSELSFTSEQLLLLSPSIKNTWTNDNENPVNTSIMSDYKQPQLQLSKNKMGAKPITRATNRMYNELMTVAAREGESKTIKFK